MSATELGRSLPWRDEYDAYQGSDGHEIVKPHMFCDEIAAIKTSNDRYRSERRHESAKYDDELSFCSIIREFRLYRRAREAIR